MGKVDDMRRLREAQHEQGQRDAKARSAATARPAVAVTTARAAEATPASAPPEAAGEVDPVEDAMVPRVMRAPQSGRAARVAAAAAADDTGTCSSCGKPKPLQRGVIATHQKGLGKVCPGSRKPPA